MADIVNLLKRVQEAQVQYYQTLGRAAIDYWRSVFEAVRMARTPPTEQPAVNRPVVPAAVPVPASISLVLEAASGESAEGNFLVDNKLARPVSAPVAISDFIGPDGKPVRTATTVSPATVTLEPGGQQIVKVAVAVTDEIVPGVDYRAYATVTGLSESRIPLVLRRRAAPDPPPTP